MKDRIDSPFLDRPQGGGDVHDAHLSPQRPRRQVGTVTDDRDASQGVVTAPSGAAALESYEAALAAGTGEEDHAAILKLLERPPG